MTVIHQYTPHPLTKQATGVDSYPEHHALWHLNALGVFDTDYTSESALWDRAARQDPVTVALIDTSVAWEHPCLQDVVDRARMVDFSVHDHGSFVVPFAQLDSAEKTRRDAALTNFTGVSEPSPMSTVSLPAFSGHGTAMAGLIGGHPNLVAHQRNARLSRSGRVIQSRPQHVTLPFSGVNPFCRIVPISTTSAPDPMMLAQAFRYAKAIGAEVVVFATALPTPTQVAAMVPDHGTAEDHSRIDAEVSARQALEAEIIALSQDAWVICAAGNGGADQAQYPASLSSDHDRIVSVGALNAQGLRAPYSSGADLWAPSSDEAGLDSAGLRDDPYALRLQGRATPPDGLSEREVSVMDLVTTDVPGPFGYNPSDSYYQPERDGPHLELGALFCRFGGTSGAAAGAAGAISRALQANGQVELTKSPRPTALKLSDI
jgi:hypothetical protein